jgi:integrase
LARNNPDDFIFEARHHGKPRDSRRYLRNILKPLAESLGIKGFTYQSVRRSFSTHAIDSGATVKDVQGQMRHANPEITVREYAQIIPESVRKTVGKLDRKFFSPVVQEGSEKVN